MVFACQGDSFLREFDSKVLSCTEAQLKTLVNGKKETLNGYEVILEDTILFPEGGGQPCDHGFLDKAAVLQVTRRGAQAVHFVDSPLTVGEVVHQTLDWERRQDHMQQHSGQHLISALGETVFNYPTTSWWLGEEVSYIELDTTKLKQSEVDEWEKIANEKIRAAVPVSVKVYEEGDPTLDEAHTRGLPDDHVGAVRVINIDGIDSNMCCGTHVSNLSQLQAIKMLHFEKGKKNKTNLHFLVGGRVLKYLANCLDREQKMTALLKNGPIYHADLVDKLQKSLKVTNKNLQSVLKDLAVMEAAKLKSQVPLPSYFSLHRKEADSDFMSIFISEVGDQLGKTFIETYDNCRNLMVGEYMSFISHSDMPMGGKWQDLHQNILLFLTVGDEKGAGQMVLHGNPSVVSELGPKICELLNGKVLAKDPNSKLKSIAWSIEVKQKV